MTAQMTVQDQKHQNQKHQDQKQKNQANSASAHGVQTRWDQGKTGQVLRWVRRGLGAGVAAIALGISGTPALAGGVIQVGPNLSEPLTYSGVATVGPAHSCGELSETFTMTLASDHDFLRVRVDNGPLVLLVTGPGGEYCIKATNGLAEMEGYWMGGQYQLQVGRRAGTGQDVPFNLTVSAQ